MNFKWAWCETCETSMIICPRCGNNCCNGGFGRLEDGSVCTVCELAYEYQELANEYNLAPSKDWIEAYNGELEE